MNFLQVNLRVARDVGAPHALLLAYVKERQARKPAIRIPYKEVTEDLGYPERTVYKYFRILCETGYIKRIRGPALMWKVS